MRLRFPLDFPRFLPHSSRTMNNQITVRRVRVLLDMGHGLRWRNAYQAYDSLGKYVGLDGAFTPAS